MTVKELKKELEKYPENMDVFIDERLSSFKYGLLNGVASKDINLTEEPGGETLAREKVVILSED